MHCFILTHFHMHIVRDLNQAPKNLNQMLLVFFRQNFHSMGYFYNVYKDTKRYEKKKLNKKFIYKQKNIHFNDNIYRNTFIGK